MDNLKFDCGCSFNIIGKRFGDSPAIKFDPTNINWECSGTWGMMAKGLTKGIFQLESSHGRKWCKKLKPENLEHLSALGALLRPGCTQALDEHGVSMTEHYCRRKNKQEEVEYKYKQIADILETTYGNLVYQEQAIFIVQKTAGFDAAEGETLRKAIGKKLPEEMAKVKRMYLEKAKSYGVVNETEAEELIGWIEQSQRYSFNKCVSFDTVIRLTSIGKHKRVFTVEELYNIRNDIEYAKRVGSLSLHKKFKLQGRYNKSYSIKDGRLKPNEVLNITKAGKNPVFKVTLTNDSSIKVTANHKFPTDNGDIMTMNLKIGDELYLCGDYEIENGKKYNWSSFTKEDLANRELEKHNHCGFLTGEQNCGYTNGKYTKWKENCKLLNEECYHCGNKTDRMEVHYKDGNRENNELNNLENLCVSCHKKIEYKAGRTKRGEKGYPIQKCKIKSIDYIGIEETYDIEMAAPNHTFVTLDNIVVCNSHSMSYGVLGYVTAYLKYHFPIEFFTSWLFYAKEKQKPLEEINELINEGRLFDIEVLPPDIRKLNKWFDTDGKVINFGICDIKGVGESGIEKLRLISHNYDIANLSWLDFLTKVSDKLNSTVCKNLIQVGALSYLNLPRQKLLYEYEIYNELTDKEKVFLGNNLCENLFHSLKKLAPIKKNGGGTANIKRAGIVEDLMKMLDNPPYPLTDTPESIALSEEALLGVSITCSKIDGLDTSHANCTCKDFLNGKTGYLYIAAEILKVREYKIKSGQNIGRVMAYITITDNTALMDTVVCFADQYEEFKELLQIGSSLLFNGERNKDGGFRLKNCWPLTFSAKG